MSFLDNNFLLINNFAKELFFNYAHKMPIIDYHCHLNPQTIYENHPFKNITKVWLNDGNYGDHYKWRLERDDGIPEAEITGNADDHKKFLVWARTIENCLGNPVYEWTNLELKRFFKIDQPLTTENAESVWGKTNHLLHTAKFRPRNLIKFSNVQVVCTTDDPISDLHYQKLTNKEEKENGFRVLPAMRPDRLIAIQSKNFPNYIKKLEKISATKINTFNGLLTALDKRFEFFSKEGGKLSDHSLPNFYYQEANTTELDLIFKRAKSGKKLNQRQRDQYLTSLILGLMRLNKKYGWTMQFHLNSDRNLNEEQYKAIGPDTGYDAMGTQVDMAHQISLLFQEANKRQIIPRIIVYSLNPNDWLQLTTLMGCFEGEQRQWLQLGAAWWFNDTVTGIEEQINTFANQSKIANFVGMLTDSRSFLSYPRHEYFRRILCSYFAKLAEEGRIPQDEKLVGRIVQNISYNNAAAYFNFFNGKDPNTIFAPHNNPFQF